MAKEDKCIIGSRVRQWMEAVTKMDEQQEEMIHNAIMRDLAGDTSMNKGIKTKKRFIEYGKEEQEIHHIHSR